MAESFVRKHILAMSPYEPILPLDVVSKQLQIPIENLVKLDANENPYGIPPSARRRLANLSYGHIYPDPESRQLRAALSLALKIPDENIIVGAGADELIDLVIRLTMEPGDKIIDCPPTFSFYSAVSQINALNLVSIKRQPDFSLAIDSIRKAAKQGAKAIFLANPNNPDGSMLSTETLHEIIHLPLLVILDEAYINFASCDINMTKLVLERNNLIILRTFSKWGGLAGLRLGYGIFPKDLHEALMKIKQPYNVSVAASQAGLGAIEDLDLLNLQQKWILAERSRLFKALQEIEWLSPYPSQANFILCRVVGVDAARLKTELYNQGILIRYFNKPGLQDHVRFSIGKQEDTDRLLEALKELAP